PGQGPGPDAGRLRPDRPGHGGSPVRQRGPGSGGAARDPVRRGGLRTVAAGGGFSGGVVGRGRRQRRTHRRPPRRGCASGPVVQGAGGLTFRSGKFLLANVESDGYSFRIGKRGLSWFKTPTRKRPWPPSRRRAAASAA